MAVVRSPDFLRALIRETALATLIHQRRLTPSCGGHAPTAERTVGPARMIAESLTPKPGIREHNLPRGDICGAARLLVEWQRWVLVVRKRAAAGISTEGFQPAGCSWPAEQNQCV